MENWGEPSTGNLRFFLDFDGIFPCDHDPRTRPRLRDQASGSGGQRPGPVDRHAAGGLRRRNPTLDAAHYLALVREHDVDRIVVGLPLHTGGGESDSSSEARRWGNWLSGLTGLPVVFFDERYSTVEADDVLRSAGIKPRDRKAKRDMLAARILLQNYLDAGCPVTEKAPEPLADEPDS